MSLTQDQLAADEKFYEQYLRDHPEIVAPPRFYTIMEQVGDKDQSILDVGAGSGDLLYLLKNNGYKNIFGIDYSAVARKYALKKGVKIANGNLEDSKVVGVYKRKFDRVICGEILEHIFDPGRVIPTLGKFLKDDGKLIISVPNAGWFLNGIFLTFRPQLLRLSPAFGVWTHVNQFTSYSMCLLLEGHGFKVEKVTGTKYWLGIPPKRALFKSIVLGVFKSPIYLSNLFVKVFPSVFSSQLIFVARKK